MTKNGIKLLVSTYYFAPLPAGLYASMPYAKSMTSSLSGQPSTAGSRDRSESKRRKSVLFCQSCGHESPADGDWRVARVDRRTRHERTVYTCPGCAYTVAVRPGGRQSGDEKQDQDRGSDRNRSGKPDADRTSLSDVS